MNATTHSTCPEAGSGERMWMEDQHGSQTCHHCHADHAAEEPTMNTAAAYVATALRDAATCYRAGDENRAAEHVHRAMGGMNRHGMTAELQGQAQVIPSFAYLGLIGRAAEVADTIADATERVYA